MMRPLLPLLLCLPLLGVETSGPTLPPIKGVKKVSSAPLWVAYGTRAMLRHLPGATVVVEDSLEILPHDLLARPFSVANMRFRGGELRPDPRVTPVPDWMNPTVVMAGPNVIQRSYSFGGATF